MLGIMHAIGAQVDGQLTAGLEPFCNKDINGGRSITLSCGNIETDSPSDLSVTWQTPESATPVASTQYNNGNFYLVLPVRAGLLGTYRCKVGAPAGVEACGGRNPCEATVRVHVDDLADTACSLALLEKEMWRSRRHQAVLVSNVFTVNPTPGSIIRFRNVRYGSGYTNGDGKFRAAYSGDYLIACTIVAHAKASRYYPYNIGADLVVNGNKVGLSAYTKTMGDHSVSTSYNDYQSASLTGVVHLEKGDYVWIAARSGGHHIYPMSLSMNDGNSFSAVLLRAD